MIRLFWRIAYCFCPRPATWSKGLKRLQRTGPMPLSKQFKPHVCHNGNEWEVWLGDEPSHTEPGVLLTVDAHVSNETGKVVGLSVLDIALSLKHEVSNG